MKTAILAIIILMIGAWMGYAVEVKGNVEAGIDPFQNETTVQATIGIPFRLWIFQSIVYYSQDVFLDNENLSNLDKNIISNEYKVGAMFTKGNVYFGYEHRCFHPTNDERPADWNSLIKFGVNW